jgi:hypothetical protein
MVTEILKTLSDTELTAIAQELNNPKIDNLAIYNQLVAKSNYPTDMSDFLTLPTKVAVELSERLLEIQKREWLRDKEEAV